MVPPGARMVSRELSRIVGELRGAGRGLLGSAHHLVAYQTEGIKMTTDTRKMMESAGGTASAELTAAIDALGDCEKASNACAMAMVEGGGMVVEIRRALDCADVCDSTERVLARSQAPDPQVVAAVVAAAIAACDASAAACGAHAGHHAHCRMHSGSAKACADALRALQGTLPG
jgi:hypothetical protein